MLRDHVREHLLHQIEKGNLQMEQTLNLAKIARELNLSVTPVREALSQLEQSEIVVSAPNRGFIIPNLNLNILQDLYQTVSELEVLALDSLKESVATYFEVKTTVFTVKNRLEINKRLLQYGKNKVLQRLVLNLHTKIGFYEGIYLKDKLLADSFLQQWDSIQNAVLEENIPTAKLLLKMNWISILELMEQRVMLNQNVNF